jgi:hypothetical protein
MAQIANSVIGTKPADAPIEVKKPEKKNYPLGGFLAVMAAMVMGAFTLVLPASADPTTINLTWVGPMFASIFDALTSIIPSLQTFIETGFPLLVEIVVYGAIIAILALLVYAFRGLVEAGIKMLENIFKQI